MSSQPPSINNLPYDVFRQIIIHANTYTLKPLPHSGDFSTIQRLAPPLSASCVCRAWRCALLSDRMMWTDLSIPDVKPSGIKELVPRSQSAPLNVSLIIEDRVLRYKGLSAVLSVIFQNIDRFESLRVYIENQTTSRAPPIGQLLSSLRSPAPMLQTFSFSASPYFQRIVLKNLFSGSAPNLKSLNYQVSMPYPQFNSSLFNRLSEFHLSCDENANFRTVLAFFEASPSLEVIGIYLKREMVTNRAWLPALSREPVNLPHLRSLMLQAYNSHKLMKFINEYLTFPSNVKWNITVLADHSFEDSPPLLELMPQVHFTNLNVLFQHSPFIISDDNAVPRDSDNLEGNKLTYSFYDSAFRIGTWGDILAKSVDFSRITHLNLELLWWERFSVKMMFFRILSDMVNLQYLGLRQKAMPSYSPKDQAFLQCLSILGFSTQDGKPPCPLLCQIIIQLEEPLNGTYVTTLSAYSKARRERGYPVKFLVFSPKVWKCFRSCLPMLSENVRVVVIPHSSLPKVLNIQHKASNTIRR